MADRPRLLIHRHFATLPDPRIERTKRHQLLDIITIAVCAVLSGADSWVDVELYGQAKHEWLATFLDLPHGIPSHDTFGRVFARLDPAAFEGCFLSWVAAVLPRTAGEVIAVDSKVVRRSHDRGPDAARSIWSVPGPRTSTSSSANSPWRTTRMKSPPSPLCSSSSM